MKKTMAMVLALIMMMIPMSGTACENVLLVNEERTACSVTYWAMTEEHFVAGIKDYGETLDRLTVQNVRSEKVLGCYENGLRRQAAYIRIMTVDETVIGLTAIHNVKVTIDPEFSALVQGIVERRVGAEITANAVIAATMWREGDYITHIFFPTYADRFIVGEVRFNADDMTYLYCGDFDGDGTLELGFAPGWWIPDPVEEEPEQDQPAQESQTATAQDSAAANASASADAAVRVCNSGSIDNSGDGCWRNNVTVQINLFNIIKQGIKIIKEACQ